jgi:hypothetical protein
MNFVGLTKERNFAISRPRLNFSLCKARKSTKKVAVNAVAL